GTRLDAAECATAIFAVCQRGILDPQRKVRTVLGAARGTGIRSRAYLHATTRVAGRSAGPRGAVSVDPDLVTPAPVLELDVRQRTILASWGRTGVPFACIGRRAAGYTGWGPSDHSQRSGTVRGHRARRRCAEARRRLGAVDLVGEVHAGWTESKRDDLPARNRPRPRPGVLRQPRRGVTRIRGELICRYCLKRSALSKPPRSARPNGRCDRSRMSCERT